MNILIHEPNHSGHRLTTVRVLIDALLSIKAQDNDFITISLSTTQESLDSKEFELQIATIRKKIEVIVLVTMTSGHPLKIANQQVGNLKRLICSRKFDHIYVPYADAVLQLLTLYRLYPLQRWWPSNVTIEAQIMHSSFAYPFTRFNRRILSLVALRWSGCDRVHINDPLGFEYIKRKFPSFLKHVFLIPDPISETTMYDKSFARSALSLPTDCRIIGCVGMINERKGADVLINSFISANLEKQDILLLVGKMSPSVRTTVQKLTSPKIIAIDRYVTDNELSLALAASDLIVTPYPNVVGSASIVIRAAMAGRMVLTNNTGWAGYVVPHFNLGLTASVDDLDDFTKILENALSQATNYQQTKIAAEYCQFNSVDNIHAHWTSFIRQKIGIGESSQLDRWRF